jgi:nicotinate-nucleotide adenylyltransferase
MFGGAFDPPHIAHVALAKAAVEQLGLDELRVFPTGQAWHKSGTVASPEDRLAMARIAFGDLARTVVDDRELHRAGPTYTIDTLRELGAQYPGAQLYLVMGEDQAVSLTRWRDWQAVLRLAT